MTDRRVQIYLVSNRTLQELMAGLLAGIDSITVDIASSDLDEFVIVESSCRQDADEVQRFVRAVDPGVKLVHTSAAEPVEPNAA